MTLFDWTAAYYRQHRSGVPVEVASILVRAAPRRRPRRLLDLGTGTGFVIEALRAEFEDVVGVDVDRALLDVARSSIVPRAGQQLQLVEASAESFRPRPDGPRTW